MYMRKWTMVPFHQGIALLRQHRLLNYATIDDRHLQLKPVNYQVGKVPKEDFQNQQESRLLNKLFKHYPELKYVPFGQFNPGQRMSSTNYITKFIKKQKSLIGSGYSEEKAFELTEKLFQKEMQRRIDQNQISHNLALNVDSKSLFDHYQQQADYESKLKVKRLQRDFEIFQRETERRQQSQDPEEQPEEVIPEEDFFSQQLMSKYKKALVKIVSETTPNSEGKPDHKAITEQFISRTNNLFEFYFSRIAVIDKLSRFKDDQICKAIRESPHKIKSQLSKVLKKLQKYGVTLNEQNELEIPTNLPANIKKTLQSEEFVAALRYKEIQFEFDHRQHLDIVQRKIRDLKNQAFQKRKEEQLLNQGKKSAEEIQEDVMKILKDADIKIPTEKTYQLFESNEERLIRLEIKWHQKKLSQFELQELENDENASPKIDQTAEKINQLVGKLRLLKFKIEQKSLKEAAKQVFEEHSVLIDENFTDLGEVSLDEMEKYLAKPAEQRRLTSTDQLNDDIIQKMIKIKQLQSPVTNLGFADIENLLDENALQDRTDIIKKKQISDKIQVSYMRVKKEKESVEDKKLDYDEVMSSSPGDMTEIKQDEGLKQFLQRAKASQDKTKERMLIEKQNKEKSKLAEKKGQKGSKDKDDKKDKK